MPQTARPRCWRPPAACSMPRDGCEGRRGVRRRGGPAHRPRLQGREVVGIVVVDLQVPILLDEVDHRHVLDVEAVGLGRGHIELHELRPSGGLQHAVQPLRRSVGRVLLFILHHEALAMRAPRGVENHKHVLIPIVHQLLQLLVADGRHVLRARLLLAQEIVTRLELLQVESDCARLLHRLAEVRSGACPPRRVCSDDRRDDREGEGRQNAHG
mmetsp:Transcript_95644/g.187780  ORF Transcript_95644/g.187780 Transcript_95644/m.187780 type:complete len:213 (+) Transcript_95644:36-674(+)